MFFRHQKPREYTFSDRIAMAERAGFQARPISSGKTRVTRGGLAADVSDAGQGMVEISRAGVLLADEIAVLVDVGYQKVFETPSGRRTPARAEQLKALHALSEDLREAFGLTSFYNQGLGSTNELHLYDRVENRDQPAGPRPWESGTI
jgi:hypothetical protein